MINHVGGGVRIQMVKATLSVGLAGAHTSQLDLTAGYKNSDKTKVFPCNYFVTGEDNKAIFSIPGHTLT